MTAAVLTDRPEHDIRVGQDLFEAIYRDPLRLRQHLAAITLSSLDAARAIAERVDWRQHRTFVEVGPGQGAVPVEVARAHPHLTGGGFDLAPVRPIFEAYVAACGLGDRLGFQPGDIFADPLPPADALIVGPVLHDADPDQKRLLLAKAYDALPSGGALILYGAKIETPRSHENTSAEYACRLLEAGFRMSLVEPLAGAQTIVVGVK